MDSPNFLLSIEKLQDGRRSGNSNSRRHSAARKVRGSWICRTFRGRLGDICLCNFWAGCGARRLGERDRVKETRVLPTLFLLVPVESAEEVPVGLSLRRVDGEEKFFGPPLPFCRLLE